MKFKDSKKLNGKIYHFNRHWQLYNIIINSKRLRNASTRGALPANSIILVMFISVCFNYKNEFEAKQLIIMQSVHFYLVCFMYKVIRNNNPKKNHFRPCLL